jgi:hypothetical protein
VGVNVARRMVLKLKDAINELKMTMKPDVDDDGADTPPPGKMPGLRLQINS